MNYEFEQFFNKEGFNKSLGHFQAVSGLLDDFESKYNLADILNTLVEGKDILQHQLGPILYALLADKYEYESKSYNMQNTIDDFSVFQGDAKRWKAVDVVIAYHHPELGFTLINPKNPDHWTAVQSIKRNELVIIYAGAFGEKAEKKIVQAAIKQAIVFLEGKKAKTPDSLLKGKFAFKPYDFDDEEDYEDEQESVSSSSARKAPSRPKSQRTEIRASSGDSGESKSESPQEQDSSPAAPPTAAPAKPPAPAAPGGARRMTPMYSVPVTNELFHNGHVEAWKKVIQSYELKNAGCEVSVFYEGEKIHDINTLFKWGKVKHGSSILFAILGTEINDVAKLQRYLRQGASPQFEAFLKFPVNTVLKLF